MLVVVVFLLAGKVALADDSKDRARLHFESGLQLVEAGDIRSAILEFKAAYEARPHYSVLFNLGHAHSVLGQPVAAVEYFERYLEEGAASITASRRASVLEQIERQRARVGWLVLDVEPAGIDVSIDGVDVGRSPFANPIAVTAGARVVVASKSGQDLVTRTVEVEGRQSLSFPVRLNAENASTNVGVLQARCPVPDVELFVDDASRGKLKRVSQVVVRGGTYGVRFVRAGYDFKPARVNVKDGKVSTVSCVVHNSRGSARLKVSARPATARVEVNGLRHVGAALPEGSHTVTVMADGYETWRQNLQLLPNRQREVHVALEPTEATRTALADEARLERYWSIGLGVAGVALIAGAVTTYVWNSSRYDDWESDRNAALRAIESDAEAGVTAKRWGRLSDRAAGLQAADDIALGMAAGALAALGVSTWLWFSSTKSLNARSWAASRSHGLSGSW